MFDNKYLRALIIPLLIETLLSVTIGMMDTIMVATDGEHAVSGVSLVDSVSNLFVFLFSAFSTGGAVIASQYLGKKDKESACFSAKQLLYLSAAFSILVSLVLLLFKRPIMHLVYGHIEENVMSSALDYFTPIVISYPFLAILNSCNAIFRSMGKSKITMTVSIIMNLINVSGNSILIYIFDMGAEGAGIAGFSTSLSKETGFSAMMTYTQKHNVTVNTSALNHPGTQKLWKKRIAARLTPDRPEGVMFLDPGPDTLDTGPDVLARIVSSFTLQLESASKRLAVLKETEKLPVSLKFDAENTYYPCEFENSGYGAVVCEIMIEKATMIPSVIGVWASFAFPTIMDRISLENALRRTIMMTLKENGMDIPLSFRIDLRISEEGTDDTISSVQQLARGLTLGALSNALHQATGDRISSLPTSAEEINMAFGEGL